MGDRDAIKQWELDQLSRFLGDGEPRHQEQLRVQEHDGMWIAERSAQASARARPTTWRVLCGSLPTSPSTATGRTVGSIRRALVAP
jgi:hypothetical protein